MFRPRHLMGVCGLPPKALRNAVRTSTLAKETSVTSDHEPSRRRDVLGRPLKRVMSSWVFSSDPSSISSHRAW